MLIRIVRMTFRPAEVADFLKIFNDNKDHIRNFAGCQGLELHKDYQANHIYATYSLWEDDVALDAYRNSELFKEVWSKTKNLFADKPLAFSLIG